MRSCANLCSCHWKKDLFQLLIAKARTTLFRSVAAFIKSNTNYSNTALNHQNLTTIMRYLRITLWLLKVSDSILAIFWIKFSQRSINIVTAEVGWGNQSHFSSTTIIIKFIYIVFCFLLFALLFSFFVVSFSSPIFLFFGRLHQLALFVNIFVLYQFLFLILLSAQIIDSLIDGQAIIIEPFQCF